MKEYLNIIYTFAILFLYTYQSLANENKSILNKKNNLNLNIKHYKSDTTVNETIKSVHEKTGYIRFRFDLGLNAPQNQKADLPTSFWGSRGVNFAIENVMQIANTRIGFSYGLGVGHVRFNLDNQHILDEENGGVVVKNFSVFDKLSTDRTNKTLSLKKTIFTQTFFDFPFELQYHDSSTDFRYGFFVGVGYKIGVNLQNKMKVVYTADGSDQVDKFIKGYFANNWRQAVTFRIGWSKFHLFWEYSLTPIFREKRGPSQSQMQSFLIGLSINDSLQRF